MSNRPETHSFNEQQGRPCLERYAFHAGGKTYTVQFLPVLYLEGYDERELAALAAVSVYEVSYRLEDYQLPDGSTVAGYGSTNTGDAFQVLGAVASGIVDWAKARQPAFLCFYVHSTRAQRLYGRMIRYFADRGSGMTRLPVDPFTGRPCPPGAFWLQCGSLDVSVV